MFKNVVVDGTTSCIPEEEEEEEEEENEENDKFDTPMSSGSRRRSTITNTIASSSGKKAKGGFMSMMSTMMNKWESVEERNHVVLKANQEEKARKRDKLGSDVQFCMDLAVEYGATSGSVELFGCTLFFKDEYNRVVFKSIPTNEGKLDWIKRMCAHDKLYR
jgi:uncharacterized Zn finger protein (UPF0148 family)